MRTITPTLRGRLLAAAAALSLLASVASCGISARPDSDASGSPAASGGTAGTAAGQVPGTTPASSSATSSTPTPSPTPTPGKGPDCAAVRCTSVLVTGDMLVHNQLWEQARADALAAGAKGLDFGPMLEGQRKYLAKSDLAICHQETPVAGPAGPFSGYPSFNVPPQILTAAQQVGYQACTTASNHTVDRGTAGLVRTLDALDAAGLQHTGSYRSEADAEGVLILQTAAAKIAVISATYGLNGQLPEAAWQVDMLDPEVMIAKAKKARDAGADIVLGAMHAGEEYSSVPNAEQKSVAHALADSGQFTMIYSHHSHSVLPIEQYKGTWIAYGLGNGITELSPNYVVNNEGLLVRAQFSQDAAGTWTASDLAWAPSVMVRGPYRWCSVASDAPQGPCAGAAADAATRQRTQTVVESMGAAAAGAHELLITREP
ncbi:poly-gamma-glutamate synthesis protein (capsule biosynthesis protein) [Arthrobacter ginsengisoli]|uniref:Poly-gamma-glutamate synthesis protein (Capsule biosynthesis protein) n=1 Tax=Arthrobacter ginsengisoli TaxID=1356565 RepID=A0ABU1U6Z4_9MICC|nr:CapA family protein [Arthrobacter ginsengisoli]MDR7080958.1 poly-gamma-glutamate synthesis protein (capsule biosynthesis protein) [Arthrobacter ginsengisoli]